MIRCCPEVLDWAETWWERIIRAAMIIKRINSLLIIKTPINVASTFIVVLFPDGRVAAIIPLYKTLQGKKKLYDAFHHADVYRSFTCHFVAAPFVDDS
jgi:hypothetical protein